LVIVSTTPRPIPISRNLWIRNENNSMKLRKITGNYSTWANWRLCTWSFLALCYGRAKPVREEEV